MMVALPAPAPLDPTLVTAGAAWGDPLVALRAARVTLRPPPRMRLSTWVEAHVILPEGVSATPGPAQLWPYQREIADAIGDPELERVTLVKPVRVGFTMLLTSAVASFVANDPAPIIVLQPTTDDARDFVVSDLEPTFAATAVVRGLLEDDSEGGERNTMTSRRFPGGSLKIVAAKAPRNLRRHTTRVLLIDEADAMHPDPKEGSPLALAERRTLTFPDRKIVLGSTPVHEDTSNVLRAYAQSDQRVYEIPCPECGTFVELLWGMLEWEPDQPATAAFRCPTCKALVPERHKSAMVHAGRWRATAPNVVGHAGFRLNALVSLLHNAAWGKLAAEFLRARNDTEELQTFVNTILGQGWREEGDEVDEQALRERAEPFGLDALPEDVLCITAGTDVQHDRLETTLLGWARTNDPFVLGHVVHYGPPQDPHAGVWEQLDGLLRQRWAHPLGGALGVDAAIVDSGDATDHVYAFTFPRLRRRVWAGKGIAGPRQAFQLSASKVKRHGDRGLSGRLVLVGVDTVKAGLFDRLSRHQLRFSTSLEPDWYEQLASERKVVRYHRGQPVRTFERIKGRQAEALDCCVYALAARAGMQGIDWDGRERQLRIAKLAPSATPTQEGGTVERSGVIRSHWMERFRS
jgi:phage terminase large subunit GpA-like protein